MNLLLKTRVLNDKSHGFTVMYDFGHVGELMYQFGHYEELHWIFFSGHSALLQLNIDN